MKHEDISHPWPPNIHRYEQTYFGVPVNAFMVGGVIGILAFVVISQWMTGFSGMALGALAGLLVFAVAILFTTPLSLFHHMLLPVYLLTRWRAARGSRRMQLPLIVSSDTRSSVEILDWDGKQQGVIE